MLLLPLWSLLALDRARLDDSSHFILKRDTKLVREKTKWPKRDGKWQTFIKDKNACKGKWSKRDKQNLFCLYPGIHFLIIRGYRELSQLNYCVTMMTSHHTNMQIKWWNSHLVWSFTCIYCVCPKAELTNNWKLDSPVLTRPMTHVTFFYTQINNTILPLTCYQTVKLLHANNSQHLSPSP